MTKQLKQKVVMIDFEASDGWKTTLSFLIIKIQIFYYFF